jgi:hypothetical protein
MKIILHVQLSSTVFSLVDLQELRFSRNANTWLHTPDLLSAYVQVDCVRIFTGYLGSIPCTAVSTDSALVPSKNRFAQAVSYCVLVRSSLYLPIKEVDNPK